MAVGITPILNWARREARIDQAYIREVIAEFFATFLLCLFAVGGTLNLNVQANQPGTIIMNFVSQPTMSVFPVAFGYFLATLIFGGVSGAHVNPAISIGMAIAGRLSWIKLHAFILVQFIGGYLGCLMSYAMFKSYLDRLPLPPGLAIKDLPGSAALFNGTPGYISVGSGFLNEIILTMLFMMAFLAVKDMWNSRSPRYAQGILIGLVVIGLALSFGETTAVAINPVRDICPRVAALSLGWNSDHAMLNGRREHVWAVGLFAPFIGAILGSILYIFIVGAQLRYNDDDEGELVTIEGAPVQPDMNPQEKWRATVYIPKLGPHNQQQEPHPQVNPYARVQFRNK